MKKVVFFILMMISYVSFGQYTLENHETGNTVSDGDVITVANNNYTTHFVVHNTGTVPLKGTLHIDNIINTDGTEINVCVGFNGQGNCYNQIAIGDSYDTNSHGSTYLQPGASSAPSDIDFAHHDGTPNFVSNNFPKDYVVSLTLYNANDNTVVGVTHFTYRYNPQSAINTLSKDEFSITTSKHSLRVRNTHNTELYIYNLTGKLVKTYKLSAGTHSLYINLTSGLYIARAKADGKEVTSKLYIK